MALISKQQVVITGLQPVYSAVTASDTFTIDDDLFLHVKNAGGSISNVTIQDASLTAGGNGALNVAVAVPATTGDRMIGPIPTSYVNTSTGLVTVTYSFTTSVTAALLRM
jgi:hypothetical protein